MTRHTTSKITKEPKQKSRLGTASNKLTRGLQLVCGRPTLALNSAFSLARLNYMSVFAGPRGAVGSRSASRARGPGFDNWSGHLLILKLLPFCVCRRATRYACGVYFYPGAQAEPMLQHTVHCKQHNIQNRRFRKGVWQSPHCILPNSNPESYVWRTWTFFLSHLLLKLPGCGMGVWFSVCPSAHSSTCPCFLLQFTVSEWQNSAWWRI